MRDRAVISQHHGQRKSWEVTQKQIWKESELCLETGKFQLELLALHIFVTLDPLLFPPLDSDCYAKSQDTECK